MQDLYAIDTLRCYLVKAMVVIRIRLNSPRHRAASGAACQGRRRAAASQDQRVFGGELASGPALRQKASASRGAPTARRRPCRPCAVHTIAPAARTPLGVIIENQAAIEYQTLWDRRREVLVPSVRRGRPSAREFSEPVRALHGHSAAPTFTESRDEPIASPGALQGDVWAPPRSRQQLKAIPAAWYQDGIQVGLPFPEASPRSEPTHPRAV